MTSSSEERVLILGGPNSGKTTLLVQLYGRIDSGSGLFVRRAAPISLQPVQDGYRRLQQGLPVAHTTRGTSTSLELAAQTADGHSVDILVPDYAGEDLVHLVDDRSVSPEWHSAAAGSDSWVMLVRLADYAVPPDVLTRPIGELARSAIPVSDDTMPAGLPMDIWAVELLQALLYARHRAGVSRTPHLKLLLSCWDELDQSTQAETPPAVASGRIALLDSFCRNHWGDRYSVNGLSSQGCTLHADQPSDAFIDDGPQEMGWIVVEDGSVESDLTRLLQVSDPNTG